MSDKIDSTEKPCWNFLCSAAHDLKTPLNSIIGFGDMLRREGTELQQKMASHVYDNGQNLLNMLNRIIEYSKMATGIFSLVPVETDLLAEITCCIEDIDPGGRVKTEYNIDERPFVTDPHVLRRILSELISNALSYSPELSEVKVSVSWENAEPGKEVLRIEVRDSGPVIPQEKLPEIFRPGGKAGMYAQGYKEGLGLGLAYASASAVKLNGYISAVSSPEGEGNIFSLLVGQLSNQG